MKYHQLLRQQLDNHLSDDHHWALLRPLLDDIDNTYQRFEHYRTHLEDTLLGKAKELVETNSELKAIFDAIPELFFRIDQHNTIVSFKQGSSTHLVFDDHAVIGQSLADVFPSEFYHSIYQPIHIARTHRQRHSVERRYLLPQTDPPQVLYYEVRLLPLLKSDLLLVMRDITLRKCQELEIAQTKDRLEVQNELLVEIASTLDDANQLESAIANITESAVEVLNVRCGSVWLLNDARDTLYCLDHFDGHQRQHKTAQQIFVADFPEYFKVLQQDRAINAHDAQSDSRTQGVCRRTGMIQPIKALLHAPVRTLGQLSGVLAFEENEHTRVWTTDETQFAASLADMLSLIIESQQRTQAQSALLESEARFRILAESTDSAIFAFRKQFVYVNPALERLSGYTRAQLLHMPVAQLLRPTFAERFSVQALAELDETAIQNLDRLHLETELVSQQGNVCWLYLSVAVAKFEGELTWLASAFNITERKLIEKRLRHQAFHDSLTGLANRALFISHLESRLRTLSQQPHQRLAVLFLDLDRFKVTNDSLGHLMGDQLLIEVSRCLVRIIGHEHKLARLGGDEFAILIESLQSISQATQMADCILQAFKQPMQLDLHEVMITASIGIAIADHRYKKAEHILRDADIAMYRAKAKGKACHEVFDEVMHQRAQRVMQIENELYAAVRDQAFTLHYQPIVDLKQGITSGFEALIRWQKADGQKVPPDEFIPIAEENGLILPIGEWVARQACQQIALWSEQFAQPPSISINLSSRQFDEISLRQMHRTNIIKSIESMVNTYGIVPGLLKLELTESVIISQSDDIMDTLSQLKNLGCSLMIDDFGTGYSSLSYLNRLPIDVIKIDRSFIMDLGEQGENQKIVRAIVSLAHSLHMRVIAEGIETPYQLKQLIELGCDAAQGYFFSKPVAADQAALLISQQWPVIAQS